MWPCCWLHGPHGAGFLHLVCQVMLSSALQVNKSPSQRESRYCFVLWGQHGVRALPSYASVLFVSGMPLWLAHLCSFNTSSQPVNSCGFWGCTVSVATTQLYFVREASVGSAYLGGHGYVPGNPFTTTGPDSSLLIPDEKTELSAPVNLFFFPFY